MANKSTATWIWYPGDFEIWLGNRFNNLRSERGALSPTFWKQDSHYPMVEFSKEVTFQETETIEIAVEGDYNVALDGEKVFGMPKSITIPAGRHKINIKVINQSCPPALFVQGKSVQSDESWLATFEDKIWIDENGDAHGSGIYVPAGRWNFNDITTPPSAFRLQTEEKKYDKCSALDNSHTLYDFGVETIGYVTLKGIKGDGTIHIYYGESAEEAQDKEHCETLDKILVETSADSITDLAHNITDCITSLKGSNDSFDYILRYSKAFRYVMIECEGDITVKDISMLYEYLPEESRGSFRCNDDEINRIWDVAQYTMQLTTREFFMDGIKRDRWVWSGDAIQSFLMNYYLFFDTECVKRTIRLLRGKDPVTAHINTIMDYTFYWFKGIYDYYLFTGDSDFVREMYPKMQTLMDYCLGRTDENGMAEGQPDDWIFVDWVDFPMHKRGVMCFEQILFCKSLETMKLCADICGHEDDAKRYGTLAQKLNNTFSETFWDKEKHAFLHNIEDGHINDMVTKFPNIFAIIYGYADEKRKEEIKQHVLLNPDVEAITTPYMRFYELEALCSMEMQDKVLTEIKSYWGGMLKEGATSFWEKYIPTEKGRQHLAMYGRPYGKSLCHAWGASPIYLLGRYYLGVRPLAAGYSQYEIKPSLGGLEWMEGTVPTPFGDIYIKMDRQHIHIKSDGGDGTLILKNKTIKITPHEEFDIPID